MLDAYFKAFEYYLKTGDKDPIARYFDDGSRLAFLNVYRNGYLKASVDALNASYPVVRSLVGENYFGQLTLAYAQAHPPKAGTLVGYGSQFAEFLRSRSNQHRLEYLADAAAIDAAWLASFFASTVAPLSPSDIETLNAQGKDVSRLHVRLTPATQLVKLGHRIVETWALIREQGTLNSVVQLIEENHTAMLWRLDGRIHIKELEPGEAAFVSSLVGFSTLEAASTRAIETDAAFDLANLFAALLENQILQLEHPIV